MITFYNLTFQEIIDGAKISYKDPHGIASSLCEEMKRAFLQNPSGYRPEEVCQILALDDDVVVGCTNAFSGRVRMDSEVLPVQNGSYLFSHEDYRKENVGGELFMRISSLQPRIYFAGISHMAMGLYRVLKFNIFEFPRMIYLKNCRSVVEAVCRTKSRAVLPLVWAGNACLWLHRQALRLRNCLSCRAYRVEEVTASIPQDVEDIVLSDSHPFAELHDRAWFEWNMQHKFSDEPRTKRLFVVKKQGRIEAFFLIKEQFYAQASSRGFRDVTLGSVMEWGIRPDSELTEKDIYMLAVEHVSPNVDGVVCATADEALAHSMRRWLFVGIGTANAAVKFKGNKDPRIKDINCWRIRMAGSDTLLN